MCRIYCGENHWFWFEYFSYQTDVFDDVYQVIISILGNTVTSFWNFKLFFWSCFLGFEFLEFHVIQLGKIIGFLFSSLLWTLNCKYDQVDFNLIHFLFVTFIFCFIVTWICEHVVNVGVIISDDGGGDVQQGTNPCFVEDHASTAASSWLC